jgi:hypothetical protein
MNVDINKLNHRQVEVLLGCMEYLSGGGRKEFQDAAERENAFGLMGPCEGCVPDGYADGDILEPIRKKFAAVYWVACQRAERALKKKGENVRLSWLCDASYEDATGVAILNDDKPYYYLREFEKAWHVTFEDLAQLADRITEVERAIVAGYRSAGR